MKSYVITLNDKYLAKIKFIPINIRISYLHIKFILLKLYFSTKVWGKEMKNKTIILMRHAKSSWDDTDLSDHERPLNKRGMRDAPAMGKFLKNKGYFPEMIISSTAKRTRMTLKLFLEGFNLENVIIDYDRRIYENSASEILDIINKEIHTTIDTLMILGHNPDMENLTTYLSGHYLPVNKFSTASIAILEFPVLKWSQIEPGNGKLVLFQSPGMI